MQKIWQYIVQYTTGLSAADASLRRDKVSDTIDTYNSLYQETKKGKDQAKVKERKVTYTNMVNAYYDLVTDFYEYGWGQSFHFAPRFQGEDFHASLARHELFLALKLGLKDGMKTLDMGCGVGGPMRAIARLSGAQVVGVNNNDYQIARSDILSERAGLSHLCSAMKCDFMKLPFEVGTFDAAYAMEATCHAPDRAACYKQVFNVLKEGGLFANFEWVMTDRYDDKNDEHNLVKHQIEHGDSLPELIRWQGIVKAVEDAGFELVEHYDYVEVAEARGNNSPWYATLQGGLKLSQIKHSKIGRFLTQRLVEVLEFIHIAPKGTGSTHTMLSTAAEGLSRGGELKIFTPMYFFLARKPFSGASSSSSSKKGGKKSDN